MKKTVALTAPTGMLGSMVYQIFKDKYNLVLIYRDKKKLKKLEKLYGGISKHRTIQFDLSILSSDYLSKKSSQQKLDKLIKKIGAIDAFVNCAGIIIPQSLHSPINTFFINSALPHILSSVYKNKLIHITTDCAYSGKEGAPYDENSPKTPQDLYGLSKSIGEPSIHSFVLRTSIIGTELDGKTSLLEWVKAQDGKTIDGYTNHYWNGLTTKQLALVFSTIIDNRSDFPRNGLFHVFSTAVSKYELVKKIKEKYKLNIMINPKEVSKVDRRLTTIYPIQKQLKIPSLDTMFEEL